MDQSFFKDVEKGALDYFTQIIGPVLTAAVMNGLRKEEVWDGNPDVRQQVGG